MYPDREFGTISIEQLDKLAMILTGFTWTPCTGFECRGLVFLNDSESVDSAQEYAAIKDGRQVEPITFGWCSEEKASHLIREILVGDHGDMGSVHPTIKPASENMCPLCQ